MGLGHVPSASSKGSARSPYAAIIFVVCFLFRVVLFLWGIESKKKYVVDRHGRSVVVAKITSDPIFFFGRKKVQIYMFLLKKDRCVLRWGVGSYQDRQNGSNSGRSGGVVTIALK